MICMRNLKFVSVSVLFFACLVSCGEDSPVVPPTPPKVPDTPPVVEIKEESLSGKWHMSREDNGIEITTYFEMKEDNTCVYTQYIRDQYNNENEVNRIVFNGKWSFDKEKSVLTFNLNDDNGNLPLTFDCILSISKDKAWSFKIDDAFSENDYYCFIKTR